MARPRKDGKPAARAVRSGRERQTESGKRWRVRAYEPTAGAPYVRVVFIHPDTGKPTSGVPEDGQSLDEKFDQIEKWLAAGHPQALRHQRPRRPLPRLAGQEGP
jgi:hypothetical protein